MVTGSCHQLQFVQVHDDNKLFDNYAIINILHFPTSLVNGVGG
jgi:hypothetical protein